MAELYIPKGVVAASKAQALAILDDWLRYSTAATIGNAEYGATEWMTIMVDGRRLVMNSNTKRLAIMHLVVAGANTPWYLVVPKLNAARRRVDDGPPRRAVALNPDDRVPGLYVYYRGSYGENVPAAV
jgi:hypothetical protein